jgi:hypothetical protein
MYCAQLPLTPTKNSSVSQTLREKTVPGTVFCSWGNKVGDVSFRLIGEPDFDLKDMVADLLKPFPQEAHPRIKQVNTIVRSIQANVPFSGNGRDIN